jgi:hypothetical protein
MARYIASLAELKLRIEPIGDALDAAAHGLATARMDSVAERYPSTVTSQLDDATVRSITTAAVVRDLVDTLDALTAGSEGF